MNEKIQPSVAGKATMAKQDFGERYWSVAENTVDKTLLRVGLFTDKILICI